MSRPKDFHADCLLCRRHAGLADPPVGGYVLEGRHFLVGHAPLPMASVGTMIIESRRHFLDHGEITAAESAELGAILRRLFPVLKSVTGAHRLYYLSLMERLPHFHLWLVPKKNGGPLRGVAYLARKPVPTSKPAAEAVARKLRRRLHPH